jgi:hypothetical protein
MLQKLEANSYKLVNFTLQPFWESVHWLSYAQRKAYCLCGLLSQG